MSNAGKARLFTTLVLFMAIGFSFIPGMAGGICMLTPTIAVLLMMLVFTKHGYSRKGWAKLGLHKLGLRGWPFALFIPVIPLTLSYLIVWGGGMSAFTAPETFHGFAWSIAPVVIAALLVKATVFESMGEELGWRGYLLPNMLGMGERKATLLNGFIHGIWHAPLILNTNAYHADENVWILFPLMVLSTMFLAPVIGRLRLRTQSVWTASIMHTSHNLMWMVLSTFAVDSSPAAKFIAGDMSLVVVLFYAALTVWMWKRDSRKASLTAQ